MTGTDALAASLGQSLALLGDYTPADDGSLPSLLARCEAACTAMRPPEPVRILHHLACTGGTMIARCLTAMPNVLLLNEIDPLSRQQVKTQVKPFSPTDLILDLRHGVRQVPDAVIEAMFNASLGVLHDHAVAAGQRLVLRDHSHSHFCTATVDPAARPTMRAVIERSFPVRAAVTVRHPLDSFLSLNDHGWFHFHPFTLEIYARRYILFLTAHDGLPVFRYEDIVENPAEELRRLCTALDLAFDAEALTSLGAIHLSGDSGRKGDTIAPRPRRPVPPEIAKQAATSPTYRQLCQRFGYAP